MLELLRMSAASLEKLQLTSADRDAHMVMCTAATVADDRDTDLTTEWAGGATSTAIGKVCCEGDCAVADDVGVVSEDRNHLLAGFHYFKSFFL